MAKKLSKNPKARKRQVLRITLKEKRKEIRGLEKYCRSLEEQIRKLSKMKPGGGRPKGHGYECKIAKMIVSTFTDYGITEKDCYRTPLSGGHRAASQTDPSDLVISKKLFKLFPFSPECKFYKEVNLHSLWIPQKKWGKSWNVRVWLAQAIKACGRAKNRFPILVFKQNKGPDLAALPELMPICAHIKRRMMFIYNKEVWYVVRFQDLLRQMKKEQDDAR